MTIDPDDYDLRELRRIADERRDGHRSDGADRAEAGRRRRTEPPRRRGRRGDGASQNGHEGHRNGRSAERPGDDGRKRAPSDGSDTDGATVRPRETNGRSRPDEPARPSDHDEVVRADLLARDLGFGDDGAGRRRDGRADRRQERRPRRDTVGRSGRSRAGRDGRDDDVGRFQFDTEIRERPRSRPGKALRQNQLEQLLVHETAASGELSKPYLTGLPDAYAAERLLFDWLEFLVLKGGFKRTMDALRYYQTVGWLTAGVEADLRDYLVGFTGEVADTDTYDVDDHHLSLVYIARLASMT